MKRCYVCSETMLDPTPNCPRCYHAQSMPVYQTGFSTGWRVFTGIVLVLGLFTVGLLVVAEVLFTVAPQLHPRYRQTAPLAQD